MGRYNDDYYYHQRRWRLNCRTFTWFLLTFFTLILLVTSLSIPWWGLEFTYLRPGPNDCIVRYNLLWSSVHCTKQGCDDPAFQAARFCPSPGDRTEFNWRDRNFPNTSRVYKVVVSLLATATFCVLLMFAITIMFLVSRRFRRSIWRILYILLGLLALICLIAITIYFGAHLDAALREDNFLCNIFPLQGTSPCREFMGGFTRNFIQGGERYRVHWGGIGFWPAVVAGVLLIPALLLAFSKRDDYDRERAKKERPVVAERYGHRREEVLGAAAPTYYRREEEVPREREVYRRESVEEREIPTTRERGHHGRVTTATRYGESRPV